MYRYCDVNHHRARTAPCIHDCHECEHQTEHGAGILEQHDRNRRIAAVEQLKTYAEIIGAGCHVVRTVLELDAVLARLPKDAQILIDTTGRNPHDLADQFEFSDFLKRRSDIRKCLVVQATTHPADALAAIRKFEMYGADCLAITKTDETTRPGAIVETISQSRLPLAYLGTGQRVPEDLQVATAQSLSNCILAVRP